MMKMGKIRLAPQSLEVQTFIIPAAVGEARGTVEAHQESRPFVQCYSQNSCVFPCTHEPEWCV